MPTVTIEEESSNTTVRFAPLAMLVVVGVLAVAAAVFVARVQ